MPEFMKGQIVDWDGQRWMFMGGDSKDKKNWQRVATQGKPEEAMPSLQKSMQEELASRSFGGKFLAGAGTAMDRAAYGLKGLFTDLSPQEKERMALNKQIAATGPGMLGSIAGDIAMTAAPSSAVANTALQASTATGRLLGSALGQGALMGGYGALTTPEARGQAALTGGAGGAAGGGLGALLSGAMRPGAGTAAEKLAKQNIPLTTGQSVGGTIKKMEDALRLGSTNIANRQREALERWGKNVVQKAMPYSDEAVSGAKIQPSVIRGGGRETIDTAMQAVDDAYSAAYRKIGQIAADKQFATDIHNVLRRYQPYLTQQEYQQLDEQAQILAAHTNQGPLAPELVKRLKRGFDKLSSQAWRSSPHEEQGKAYKEIGDALVGLVRRKGNREGVRALEEIDKAYGAFKPIKHAAGALGAEDAMFTPAQLKSAIRQLDKSPGKAAFAAGRTRPELLRETEEAIKVLGPTIPTMGPGSAEKLMIPIMSQNLLSAIPSIAAQGIYTKPIQGLLTGRYPWQQAMTPEMLAFMSQLPGSVALNTMKGR